MTEFQVPTMGQLNPKPAHLVILKEKVGVAKNSHNRCFIAFEQPNMAGVSFIQAKGFFTEETAEVVAMKFREMVAEVDKEKCEEVYIPWAEIARVKNLVFKAK
jgi:hypothetical protein